VNLGHRLVLAQTLVDHLPQQVVVGPGEILHFGDQLGPHPMHAHAGVEQRRTLWMLDRKPMHFGQRIVSYGPVSNRRGHSGDGKRRRR
jgi:hypothetical protein